VVTTSPLAKVSQPGRSTDKIAAFAGVSGRTVEKIAKALDRKRTRCIRIQANQAAGRDQDRETGGDGAGPLFQNQK